MPSSLVIFLHGVGANGEDLASLADMIRPALPDAAFASPDAPERFDGAPFGFQWFSIAGIDWQNRTNRIVGAREGFDRTVRREIEAAGFADRLDRVAFFGFSQGAMMSLDALADGRWPVAAVVAASGMLMGTPGPKAATGTPVLLLHGAQDPVVPAASTPAARDALKAAGFEVEAHIYPGLGHSLNYEGVAAAADFLKRRLG